MQSNKGFEIQEVTAWPVREPNIGTLQQQQQQWTQLNTGNENQIGLKISQMIFKWYEKESLQPQQNCKTERKKRKKALVVTSIPHKSFDVSSKPHINNKNNYLLYTTTNIVRLWGVLNDLGRIKRRDMLVAIVVFMPIPKIYRDGLYKIISFLVIWLDEKQIK
jgi:hypothetical protein